MTKISPITPLEIADRGFMVASMIERCPRTMMARELTMNAIEAAAKAPEGERIVRFIAKDMPAFPGTKKLAIWNTGPGMDATTLAHVCDLAASIGKEMRLEGNFGMGGKVASLPSNTLGMRYRSCCGGVVSQVELCKIDGVYGKRRFPVEGTFDDVLDVTDIVVNEGEYPLTYDWTELVLYGDQPEQNTVDNPYNLNVDGDMGKRKTPRQWLVETLYYRFYNIPAGVQLIFEDGTLTRDGRRVFKTIPQRRSENVFEKAETVTTPDGIKIHYLWDPPYDKAKSHNKSVSGSLVVTRSSAAIIYRGEMYDVRASQKWGADAPIFGITFGSRHISVHVEIPDDFPVISEPYRRFLQLAGDDQHQLMVDEFADLARIHRPKWLIDLIASLGPKPSANADEIEQELQELLNKLSVQARSPRVKQDGDLDVEEGNGRGSTHGAGGDSGGDNARETKKPGGSTQTPTRFANVLNGAKRAVSAENREKAPKIHLLETDEQIAEHGIENKAGVYLARSNDLYINRKYSAIDEIKAHLELLFAPHEDGDAVRELSSDLAEGIVIRLVGRTVVFAKAKELANHWSLEDVKKACEPECLSVTADNWFDAMGEAQSLMRRRLGMRRAKIVDTSDAAA